MIPVYMTKRSTTVTYPLPLSQLVTAIALLYTEHIFVLAWQSNHLTAYWECEDRNQTDCEIGAMSTRRSVRAVSATYFSRSLCPGVTHSRNPVRLLCHTGNAMASPGRLISTSVLSIHGLSNSAAAPSQARNLFATAPKTLLPPWTTKLDEPMCSPDPCG